MAPGRKTIQTGRSGEEQYMNIPYSTLHSPAWRSLGGAAIKVFLELRSRFYGSNNGKIILSYEDASKTLGLGKATIRRAFDELQEKGFIKLIKKGFWYGRMANEWAVTEKSYQGHLPTNDWKRWRPKTKGGSKSEATGG